MQFKCLIGRSLGGGMYLNKHPYRAIRHFSRRSAVYYFTDFSTLVLYTDVLLMDGCCGTVSIFEALVCLCTGGAGGPMTWSLMQRPLTKALPSAKVKHYANGLGLCTKRGGILQRRTPVDRQSQTRLQFAVHQRTSLVFLFSPPDQSPRSVEYPFDFYTERD